MRKPIGGPSCGNMPYQARFPSGAFSTAISAAPPHSPPSPTPCRKRNAASATRRENARACVGRQRADQRRRKPHRQHGGDERRFASDAIAEMAEQERADGPREEGEAEGQIGVQRLRLGRGFREEHRPEHQRRRGAENIEVVELDRRADEARERDLADARARRLVRPRSRYCCHHSSPDGLRRIISRPAKSASSIARAKFHGHCAGNASSAISVSIAALRRAYR